MQTFMLKLDRWLRRHRRVVIGTWLVLVLAAVPFAAKQSEHLSGGGYTIPGSDSQKVLQRLPKITPGAQAARLAGVIEPTSGASVSEMQSGLARLDSATHSTSHVSVSPAVRAQVEHEIVAAGA